MTTALATRAMEFKRKHRTKAGCFCTYTINVAHASHHGKGEVRGTSVKVNSKRLCRTVPNARGCCFASDLMLGFAAQERK